MHVLLLHYHSYDILVSVREIIRQYKVRYQNILVLSFKIFPCTSINLFYVTSQ